LDKNKSDLRDLRGLYDSFKSETNKKIDAFWRGKYNTFYEDTKDKPYINNIIYKKNIEQIIKYYQFIMLIRDIFDSKFINKIIDIGELNGWNYDKPLIRDYENNLDILALDLTIHFGIWERDKYDNNAFHTLAFSKERKENKYTIISRVSIVPILDIKVENDKLINIDVFEFWTIHNFVERLYYE
jgi:hypothetical protein